MNLLKFYYKLTPKQRVLLCDIIRYAQQARRSGVLRPSEDMLMFMNYDFVVECLKEYHQTGYAMHWSDYSTREILKILEVRPLPKIKPDPGGHGKANYREIAQKWSHDPK